MGKLRAPGRSRSALVGATRTRRAAASGVYRDDVLDKIAQAINVRSSRAPLTQGSLRRDRRRLQRVPDTTIAGIAIGAVGAGPAIAIGGIASGAAGGGPATAIAGIAIGAVGAGPTSAIAGIASGPCGGGPTTAIAGMANGAVGAGPVMLIAGIVSGPAPELSARFGEAPRRSAAKAWNGHATTAMIAPAVTKARTLRKRER